MIKKNFSTSENGDHLGLFTRDLEQIPSPFANVGPPADDLFPLLGGGPEDTQVGDVFFFSSRRRHTSSLRDWSSDVCSSDLKRGSRLGGFSGQYLLRFVG